MDAWDYGFKSLLFTKGGPYNEDLPRLERAVIQRDRRFATSWWFIYVPAHNAWRL